MAQNSDNIAIVRPKVAGAAYVAAKGKSVPTSAAAAATDFESLGWLSEDGITMTVGKDTTDLIGFGGDVALTIQNSHDVTFTLKPLEMNATVLKQLFGDSNVTTGTGGKVESVTINASELTDHPWMFDLRGRNKQLVRVCVPVGMVTDQGELPFKTGEAVASEITVKALPDASGNKAYIYFGTES